MTRFRQRDADRNEGSALVWALLFVVVTSGMIVSHAVYLASSRRDRDVRYSQEAMSSTFGRSGLVDALGWFRRQPIQPVTNFTPLLDPGGDPPVLDTIDPVLGLVREFEIRGNLWGRYEVRKAEVVDISTEKGVTVPGSVWELGVRSYVYRIEDDTKSFNEAPNSVVATTAMLSEMRGIPIVLPAEAALCCDDPLGITVGRQGQVRGGTSNPALAYPDAEVVMAVTPTPTIDGLATVDGTPAELGIAAYKSSPKDVFKMRLDELQDYSDNVKRDNAPLDVVGSVMVVPGDLTVANGGTVDRSLLIVRGNLTVTGTTPTTVNGVVFVSGNAVISGRFTMRGAMVVRGTAQVGTGAENVSMVYDPDIVQALRQDVGQYRLRRSIQPGR